MWTCDKPFTHVHGHTMTFYKLLVVQSRNKASKEASVAIHCLHTSSVSYRVSCRE